ncbi:MAG: winged helix-turn-helix domain-containing protein, partial [Woeseiaceae bacterium]
MVAAVQSSVQSTRYRFGDLTLDVGLRCVARDGHVLHLGKLTYEMLAALVEAAPNVVTQDELVQRVWGGRIATPETLTQRAKLLRLALGEDADRPRYVQVVRGQGYRLIPPVERESEITSRAVSEPRNGQSPARPTAHAPADMQGSPPSDARPARRPQRFLAAGALVVAVGIVAAVWIVRDQGGAASRATAKSIAVLPFTDMSEGRNQQFIADGITDEILDRLTRNPGRLRVIARTSSFSFRDRAVEVPEIAAKLDVTHVLEGSVRRSGDRVRITVQLVDGADASHVWSATYDRTLGELFAVQDDIAGSIADALQVTLAGGEAHGGMPDSIEAYERFLQGQFFYHRRAPGDIERSVKYYEEAVAIDPQYARTWAALAGAYSLLELRDKQGEAARKAVELEPRLAVAHARLSQYYYYTGQPEKGDEHWRAALALDPDDPLVLGFSGGRAIWRGNIKEAVAIWRRLVARDPLSSIQRGNLASMLLADGQWDGALSEYRRALELNPEAGSDLEIQ